MERIKALIDKIYQQKQEGCHPARILLTVQILHSELIQLQQSNGSLGTAKVAVRLPANFNFASEEILQEIAGEQLPVKEDVMPFQGQAIKSRVEMPVIEEESLQYTLKRQVKVDDKAGNENHHAYQPSQVVLNPAFDTFEESSPILQYNTSKELHEVISASTESLNDKLKQQKTELVHILKDSPIKDLRKGIGINDRFTFLKELFRGDEAMYERSIKTINNFTVFQEAEYWMNRELKYKLGWSDSKEIVQHFYQLVKRRFS